MPTGNLPIKGDWGAIIGGAATLGGAYIGYKGQQATNAANAQQAKAQMDFQREMANTSFQRGRADLEAAGYNPALAYSKGGADSPQGSKAEMQNSLAAFGGSAQAAVNTINSIQQTKAAVAKTNADTELTKAQANQLNLESSARASIFNSNASLLGTNARFANETYEDRRQGVAVGLQRDIIDKNRARLEYDYHGDMYQRNKDTLWPLAVEQLKQDLTTSQFNSRLTAANARLSELAIPTAENIAKAAQTKWGKNISPFLSDAATLSKMLSGIAGTAAYYIPK